MKNHLLFAAMLALSAAPAVAAPVAAQPYFPEAEAPATLATEDEYNALVKSIEDLQADLQKKLEEVTNLYPEAETLPATIKGTLSGDGSLEAILAEVKEKHAAGTLTEEEVTSYQATVNGYAASFSGANYDIALKEAAGEHFQSILYAYSDEAKDDISKAEEGLDEDAITYDYISSSMDYYGGEIDNVKFFTYPSTQEALDEAKLKIEEARQKALDVANYASDAEDLAKDLKPAIAKWNDQISRGETDMPDNDWDEAKETVKYWQGIYNVLTDYIADDATPYTKADIEDMSDEFISLKDNDLYVSAQKEAWLQEYNVKYYPVSQRIDEITATLDTECPHVAEKYMTRLEDLTEEMTQASMKLMGDDPVSEDEFNTMMARVDEIAKEAEKILTDAKAEELATGINAIAVDEAVKSGKAYTLDGKRASNAQKGIVIVDGKKIVLKK